MVPNRKKFKALLVLFLAGMILLNGLVLWRAWWEVLAGYPDFSIFYTAGLILRRGQGTTLYDNMLQLQVQREFASAALGRTGPLPYNHPPFEAALFVPLTHFPYLTSYALWALLNFCLLAGVIFFMRPPPRHPVIFPWFWFLAALAFFPVAYALMQGQDSIMLLALYCLTYKALRRGHDLQAGVWLGLGLFKFHLVLPFVFVLLLRRRLRAILGVLLGKTHVLDFLVSGCLLVGWKEVLRYPYYVWQVNRHSSMRVIVPENMPQPSRPFPGMGSSSIRLPLVGDRIVVGFCRFVDMGVTAMGSIGFEKPSPLGQRNFHRPSGHFPGGLSRLQPGYEYPVSSRLAVIAA